LIAMKFMLDSVATALAIIVFEQPGGPYIKIPFGARIPKRVKASAWSRGHSTACWIFYLTSSYPPISDQYTLGISVTRSFREAGAIYPKPDITSTLFSCRSS
jgi:hypothetical protein